MPTLPKPLSKLLLLILIFGNTVAFGSEVNDDFFNDDSVIEEKPIANQNNDPLEKINRLIFGFYNKFDIIALEPIAKTYSKYTPDAIKYAFSSSIATFSEPVYLPTSIFSGKLVNVQTNIHRFFINFPFGALGFIDLSTEVEVPRKRITLGQVLRKYGVPEGPYFVGIIGGQPGNLIDVANSVDSFFFNIYTYNSKNEITSVNNYRSLGSILTSRADSIEVIDNARKTSVDLYLVQKNFYLARKNTTQEENIQNNLDYNSYLHQVRIDEEYFL